MKTLGRRLTIFFSSLLILVSCSSTQNIGLMSLGNLENKTIPADIKGEQREGVNCGVQYSLAEAVRDALKNTNFDTLIDVKVTHETGIFVWSNCIKVKGYAISSNKLK
jgi:hypothetical protein